MPTAVAIPGRVKRAGRRNHRGIESSPRNDLARPAAAFNCFMNVPVDGAMGRFRVLPPLRRAGDRIAFRARMDLVIGLTACSAPDSNGGTFKPIEYRIDR